MTAFSTLPLNRPATVEGSVGKGAWCGRCWATDTGPQKESDATGSRNTTERKRERAKGGRKKKAFQGQTREKKLGNDSKTGRKKTANTANNFVVVEF